MLLRRSFYNARSMPISPARAAAFDILLRVERDSAYASEVLHSTSIDRLPANDHALATELVMGVLRWRSCLDDQIASASSQPLSKLDLEILIALRLALYQFRSLTRVPTRAALHESVELVKRARKRSAAPFVNAVLRRLSNNPPTPLCPPVLNGVSSEALATQLAHPLWLVDRWTRHYGLAAAEKICRHDQTIPTTAIRLRNARADSELAAEISLLPGAFLSSARRVLSGDVSATAAFRSKHVFIQDEASQLISALAASSLDGQPWRVLDCCAAPGGKTLAIADQLTESRITAVELHPHRARLLKKLAGVPPNNIKVIAADARHLPFSISFDRVLADVPCSGTGTLARNPEIKWRLSLADLADLHERQLAILRTAMAHVAVGGRLVYSTCSLEKEENEDVVEEALRSVEAFRVVDCNLELDRLKNSGTLVWPDVHSLTSGPYLRTIPGIHPCDGFFAAILEKKSKNSTAPRS